MKKKVLVQKIKEILSKSECEINQLEELNKIFEQETQDQITLFNVRRIRSKESLDSLLLEVFKKWTRVIEENEEEFKWLLPRVKNFWDSLEQTLKNRF